MGKILKRLMEGFSLQKHPHFGDYNQVWEVKGFTEKKNPGMVIQMEYRKPIGAKGEYAVIIKPLTKELAFFVGSVKGVFTTYYSSGHGDMRIKKWAMEKAKELSRKVEEFIEKGGNKPVKKKKEKDLGKAANTKNLKSLMDESKKLLDRLIFSYNTTYNYLEKNKDFISSKGLTEEKKKLKKLVSEARKMLKKYEKKKDQFSNSKFKMSGAGRFRSIENYMNDIEKGIKKLKPSKKTSLKKIQKEIKGIQAFIKVKVDEDLDSIADRMEINLKILKEGLASLPNELYSSDLHSGLKKFQAGVRSLQKSLDIFEDLGKDKYWEIPSMKIPKKGKSKV